MGAGSSIENIGKVSPSVKKITVQPYAKHTDEEIQTSVQNRAVPTDVESDTSNVVDTAVTNSADGDVLVAQQEVVTRTNLPSTDPPERSHHPMQSSTDSTNNRAPFATVASSESKISSILHSMKIDLRHLKKSDVKDASHPLTAATDMNSQKKETPPKRQEKEKKLAWNSQKLLSSTRSISSVETRGSHGDCDVPDSTENMDEILQDYDEDTAAVQP